MDRIVQIRRFLFPERYLTEAGDTEVLGAFEERSGRLNLLALRMTAGTMAVITILSWPLDALVGSPDSEMMNWLIQWRLALIAICVLGLALVRFSRTASRHPVGLTALMFSLGVAMSGHLTALAGGMESPVFYGVYSTPLMSVLIITRLKSRAFITFGMTGSYFLTFFLTAPDQLYAPLIGMPISWTIAASVTSIIAGQVVYYLLFSNFVQRRTLDQRTRELEELDRKKNEFFANVNHELRTPLTNIVGVFSQLEREDLDDRFQRLMFAGRKNTDRLLSLVTDLLEISRLDSGRDATRRQVLDLGTVVAHVVGEFVSESGHEIHLDQSSDSARLVLEADPRQLRTVIYNIISNAIKFSNPDDGPVEIVLHSYSNQVGFSVTDHGLGMPPEQLPLIFDRFHQVQAGLAKQKPGVGIGLSLAKEIVARHGGSIDVQSEVGKGSTFTVSLPRSSGEVSLAVSSPDSALPISPPYQRRPGPRGEAIPVTPPEAARPNLAERERPLILVVEDDPDLRAYLLEFLARRYHVLGARDGLEALDIALQNRPDLVLTDVMMPRMSGLELLASMRQKPVLKTVPCIFLTAVTGVPMRIEALREGASDYVQKPFQEAELIARIDNLLKLDELTRNLTKKVDEQTAELRQLAENIVSVQEGERIRVAREIHDETGQVLTGLGMELDRLHRHIEKYPEMAEETRQTLEHAQTLVKSVHASVDRVINALRPSVLDSQGFVSAVDWLARELQNRAGVTVLVDVGVDEEGLSRRESIGYYRIIQEALTNVTRHAKATQVSVSLEETATKRTLTVRDDGVGFRDVQQQRQGFGLLGITERSRLLGGMSIVESEPGHGTVIRVEVPIRSTEKEENLS